MEVYVKLHVSLQVLEETLFIIVRELKCELSPKNSKHMQQQAAQSQVQHAEGKKSIVKAEASLPQCCNDDSFVALTWHEHEQLPGHVVVKY